MTLFFNFLINYYLLLFHLNIRHASFRSLIFLFCCLGIMPAKKIAAPAAAISNAVRVAPPALSLENAASNRLSAPTVVTPGASGISADSAATRVVPSPLDPEIPLLSQASGHDGVLPDGEAIAFANALALAAAQTKAARIAAMVKSGLASKLAERANLAAIERANREAADELSEINATIEAGLVEADRVSALKDKATKRKAQKAAQIEAAASARIEAETLRLAAFYKETDGESDDEVVIIPAFVPPPPSARELASLSKGRVKPPKVVTSMPTAEDVAALKAVVAQKELLKEFELLQRRDTLLSGTGGVCYFKCCLVYSHTFLPQLGRPSAGLMTTQRLVARRRRRRILLTLTLHRLNLSQRSRSRRRLDTRTPVQVRLRQTRRVLLRGLVPPTKPVCSVMPR